MTGGPRRTELWLDVALSILVHALLVTLVFLTPRFQIGTYITIPVSYQVDLISATPGSKSGGGSAPTPAAASPPAPVARSAAPPPRAVSRPSEELTLPGRQPARKAPATVEPSLRLPSVTGRETLRPTPGDLRPQAPSAAIAPTSPSPLAGAAGPATAATAPPGKGSGVELAGGERGEGSGGSALGYYLGLVDYKISTNWVPPGTGGGRDNVVVIRFRVFPSGTVRDVELETSSGDAGLDASAMRAIRQSLPLPPFPNLLTEKSLDLRYRFVMERG
jgi:TonB family protein